MSKCDSPFYNFSAIYSEICFEEKEVNEIPKSLHEKILHNFDMCLKNKDITLSPEKAKKVDMVIAVNTECSKNKETGVYFVAVIIGVDDYFQNQYYWFQDKELKEMTKEVTRFLMNKKDANFYVTFDAGVGVNKKVSIFNSEII